MSESHDKSAGEESLAPQQTRIMDKWSYLLAWLGGCVSIGTFAMGSSLVGQLNMLQAVAAREWSEPRLLGARLGQAQRLLVQIGQGLDQRKRAFARRVHQPLVGRAVGHQHGRRHLEQVAGHKTRGRPVLLR